jgi:hypothetical protein
MYTLSLAKIDTYSGQRFRALEYPLTDYNENWKFVIFQVVFWVVTPCSDLCLHLHPEYSSSKRWYPTTVQKTTARIFIAVKTSNLSLIRSFFDRKLSST